MNFNVHRRNKSFAACPPPPDRKEVRSLKKVQHLTLPDTLLSQAKDIYQNQGNLSEAVRLFQQYLGLNPRSSEARYLCGVCQLKLGRIESALEHLDLVSNDYPNKPNAMLLSAMALNKLGRITQSLEAVNQCISRFEGFEEAICFRGKLYLSLKYYHRAEQDFKALAAQPKASFLAHHSLGDCYRAQGRPEKAVGPYLKALEMLGDQEAAAQLGSQMQLKLGICLYQLERWEEGFKFLESALRVGEKSCELYYYLGGCELRLGRREEALLHLEYCLKVQGNPAVMRKAYKKLIGCYLSQFQFYEALNIVKIGDICLIHLQGWADVVEAFMAIIKGRYNQGVTALSNICSAVKRAEQSKKLLRFKRESSHPKARYNTTSEAAKNVHSGMPLLKDSKERKGVQRERKEGKLGYFSTKSVLRAIPKIESNRVKTKMVTSTKKEDVRIRTEYVDGDKEVQIYSAREKEEVYPLVLLFKAYGEFFQNQYFACLETYQEYEAYIKDLFGRDSDVLYNKSLCEALLMAENDMHDDALSKYTSCIELYDLKNGAVPLEPLLYKICLLVRLAVESPEEQGAQVQGPSQEILSSTLELMDNYSSAIGENSLAFYFRALILLLMGRPIDSCDWLERGLKVAEDCSWRWLWVKGVIETRLGNYYEAVKEFSAGLILENRAELYLGRSIAFLLLSESKSQKTRCPKEGSSSLGLRNGSGQGKKQSSGRQKKANCEVLIESCFEDLQKYIQLEDKQDEISLWVSKVLFANGAYEEAVRSLHKIGEPSTEVIAMKQAVSIYEGDFGEGGTIGQLIQAAFEGSFLTLQDEDALLEGKTTKSQPSLDADFQKWLIVLHLYSQKKYPLLLKYLQRLLFGSQKASIQALLRFNVVIVYLLLEDQPKAVNALRAMVGKEDPLLLLSTLLKLEELQFDQDECFQDLRQVIGSNVTKLLSNYLPYQSVTLKSEKRQVRIYIRPSIPFPEFPRPSLDLPITTSFILAEITPNAVEKRLDAPWIRRTEKKTVQFTEKLEESGMEICGQTESLKNTSGMSDKKYLNFE